MHMQCTYIYIYFFFLDKITYTGTEGIFGIKFRNFIFFNFFHLAAPRAFHSMWAYQNPFSFHWIKSAMLVILRIKTHIVKPMNNKKQQECKIRKKWSKTADKKKYLNESQILCMYLYVTYAVVLCKTAYHINGEFTKLYIIIADGRNIPSLVR